MDAAQTFKVFVWLRPEPEHPDTICPGQVGVRNGRINLYNSSAGKLDLTVTVTGYYKPVCRPGFFLVGPVRILNTRIGLVARAPVLHGQHSGGPGTQ